MHSEKQRPPKLIMYSQKIFPKIEPSNKSTTADGASHRRWALALYEY